MKELLPELKDACRREPSPSAAETISRGDSIWFRGPPAHAPEGTVALALSDDAKVIINEGDVLAVEKQGEHYGVAVSADSYVLLRIDKLPKATSERGRDLGEHLSLTIQQRDDKEPPIEIELKVVEICEIICGDVVIGGIKFRVCLPMNCKKF